MDPTTIVGFDLMHPARGRSNRRDALFDQRRQVETLDHERCFVDALDRRFQSLCDLRTQPAPIRLVAGESDCCFATGNSESHLSASIVASNGKYEAIEWVVVKDGQEVSRQKFAWPSGVKATGAFRLRVQMLAVGVNLYIESQGTSYLVGYPDFNQHLELRRKDLIRRFEFCMSSDLDARCFG